MKHFNKTKINYFPVPIPPVHASKNQALLELMENIISLLMKCLLVFFFKESIIRQFLSCARKENRHYHTTYRSINMNIIILSSGQHLGWELENAQRTEAVECGI